MKALVFLLLLITGVARGQTYSCDSTAYYKTLDSGIQWLKAEENTVVLQDSTVKFVLDSVTQEFKITGIFSKMNFPDGYVGIGCHAYNVVDKGDTRKITFLYFGLDLASIGISRGNEFFVYHVKNKLKDLDP